MRAQPLRVALSSASTDNLDILFPENDGRVLATVYPDRVHCRSLPEALLGQKATAKVFAAGHVMNEALEEIHAALELNRADIAPGLYMHLSLIVARSLAAANGEAL